MVYAFVALGAFAWARSNGDDLLGAFSIGIGWFLYLIGFVLIVLIEMITKLLPEREL